MKNISLLFLASLLTIVISCKKVDDGLSTLNGSPVSSMTCTVNTTSNPKPEDYPWDASSSLNSSWDATNKVLVINASSINSTSLKMQLKNYQPGTYTDFDSSSTGKPNCNLLYYSTATSVTFGHFYCMPGTGTVTITSYANDLIAGTFAFTGILSNGTKTYVKSGQFKNIKVPKH